MGGLIVFGGTKGGSGKTTLATNVSVAIARKVGSWAQFEGKLSLSVVDCDQQASFINWSGSRENLGLLPEIEVEHVVMTSGDRSGLVSFQRRIRRATDRVDLVLADCGGFDSAALRSLLMAANMCVTPVDPSAHGIGGFENMLTLIYQAQASNSKLETLVVPNHVQPAANGVARRECLELLKDSEADLERMGIRVAKMPVSTAAPLNQSSKGKGVVEMGSKAARAKLEIGSLSDDIFEILVKQGEEEEQ